MSIWAITTLESTTPLAEGTASNPRHAWQFAIDAALDQLATTSLDGCVFVIDGESAVLIPGRTEDGQLDLSAVRAAAERMAIATLGGLG
jgi:hypothetical protein